ncbi:hypothetical protein AHAS_Ahas10G0071800 [Arachis hypogaea]
MINFFDRRNEVFDVWGMSNGVEYAVDLHYRHCDSSDFQVDRFPCHHVFASCMN